MDYDVLSELLTSSGSPLPLAELHGGLCGVICASGPGAAANWLDSLLEDCSGDADSRSRLAPELRTLGDETLASLRGASLEFRPLLPDDECSVDSRADALALWCHGFLAGLVIGGLDLSGAGDSLSAEIDELVRDFAEISRAGADVEEIEDSELGESSLVELVEYVRVGAQFAFEEMAPAEPAERRTIH